ncbi:hypothetical protein HYW32_03685 [Candidatus Berkelbacteria bacterium]|nr:hypothetical protein [Candidatus Berkelbacteria bacterium]
MLEEAQGSNHEARPELQKAELQRKIHELLTKYTDVQTLAEILNAQSFIRRTLSKNRQAGEIISFDVQGFIEHTLKTDNEFKLPEHWDQIDEVILPPSEMGAIQSGESGNNNGGKQIIPRTLYLIEVLSNLNLNYDVKIGRVESTQIRKQPYVAFFLPDKNQLILICNEEGNATFVVYGVREEAINSILETTKDDLGTLFPTSRISYTSDPETWKKTVVETLERTEMPSLQSPRQKISDESPAGWRQLSELATHYNLDPGTIRHWIAKNLVENPDWLKRFRIQRPLGGRGRSQADFIAPELVKIIEKQIESMRKLGSPPTGWINAYEYASDRNISTSTAQQYFRKIQRVNHPGAGKFISRQVRQGFRIGYYCSPKAILDIDAMRENPRLRAEILYKEVAPTDWIALIDLAEESGRAYNVLAAWADQEVTHPNEEKKKYYNYDKQKIIWYVSPELADRLCERNKRTPLIKKNRHPDSIDVTPDERKLI